MEIVTEHSVVFDEEERNIICDTMARCNPVNLSDDMASVRNRMTQERTYGECYVTQRVLPYIAWLLKLYRRERDDADRVRNTDGVASGVYDARVEMIPDVQAVNRIFTAAKNRMDLR
jgi:hypothetical protein